ncbi:hypothetical protein HJC23_004035 [Cyclotella cryptica]|uniref:Uncharacterized protein n=1 Tax=Cyclotella cryptica TaxID=29204 RepID=A0ABD3QUK4_9STRA|eukprot:CCRYP_002033-RA/>CCRYP_002033-RA protein AED:0.42 eAED:0.41 QI:0/0/0/1/1/1/3/0/279
MEEYDELSAGPVDGTINLSHNTWKILPPELNNFSLTLLHVEMSNNQLSCIPEAIGDLIMLKSLDVSLNRVRVIDRAIGKCIRLRQLNVEKNRLACLPDELGQCVLLEEILARENNLSTLPQSLENLPTLNKIDVRNNELLTIPLKLCRVPTLNELLCAENPTLETAPQNMRGNSKLLIWCLEMQQKFKDVIDPKTHQHEELQRKSTALQRNIRLAKERIQQLESEIEKLEFERPDDYIYLKGRVTDVVLYVFDKIIQLWDTIKNVFVAWWNRRQTYPLY